MKKLITICSIITGMILLNSNSIVQAQNFVPNPSFEKYSLCPYEIGQVSRCISWSSFSETPDYFNVCADSASHANIPYTGMGYQQPATGNAYCGLATLSIGDLRYREAIGCRLTTPLKVGSVYFCSFKVSMGYGGYFQVFIASNGIGMKFSTKPYIIYTNHPVQIDNKPHIYSKEIITDTLNWTEISGTFIADSAYKYLVIANFFDTEHTDTLHLGPFIKDAYYFVDDVCVTDDVSKGCIIDGIEELKEPEFSIYPNPTNDYINIKSYKKITSIKIYNLLGELFYSFRNLDNKHESIYTIDCSKYPKGIYFIKINYGNLFKTSKIIIN